MNRWSLYGALVAGVVSAVAPGEFYPDDLHSREEVHCRFLHLKQIESFEQIGQVLEEALICRNPQQKDYLQRLVRSVHGSIHPPCRREILRICSRTMKREWDDVLRHPHQQDLRLRIGLNVHKCVTANIHEFSGHCIRDFKNIGQRSQQVHSVRGAVPVERIRDLKQLYMVLEKIKHTMDDEERNALRRSVHRAKKHLTHFCRHDIREICADDLKRVKDYVSKYRPAFPRVQFGQAVLKCMKEKWSEFSPECIHGIQTLGSPIVLKSDDFLQTKLMDRVGGHLGHHRRHSRHYHHHPHHHRRHHRRHHDAEADAQFPPRHYRYHHGESEGNAFKVRPHFSSPELLEEEDEEDKNIALFVGIAALGAFALVFAAYKVGASRRRILLQREMVPAAPSNGYAPPHYVALNEEEYA